MSLLSNAITWEKHRGEPVVSGDVIVTPESQSLIFHVPNFHFSWSRPVAVHVDDGQEKQRIRIIDLTRIFQLGIFSAGFIAVASLWILGRGR